MLQDDSPPDHRTTYEPAYVRGLFNRIAGRYDLLNHVLSSGIDILWRKKAVKLLRKTRPQRILDVATGTGDLAIALASLHPRQIVGIDVAAEMLRLASRKTVRRNLGSLISYQEGSAEHLPFPDDSFHAVTVAFGVRNFSSLEGGLKEMRRVLDRDGEIVILEFSNPRKFPVRQAYGLYSRFVLPIVGGLISRSREAYEYLPTTIREFPDGEAFKRILEKIGFSEVSVYPLTFGIASIYHARSGKA